MCKNADETNPLCDECFAKLKSLPADKAFTDEDMCEDCRTVTKHYCSCCSTLQKDEIDEDGLCKDCRDEFGVKR